jgi:hypothetical protein
LRNFRLSLFLILCVSSHAYSWWMWTPGGHTDNSTQMFTGGYHPDQPIAFSHKLHAGDRQIPCQFCHSAARRSITAGVPPLDTCMGCHKLIKTESPEIQKLKAAFDKNEPIKWTKVHDLPDYVRFSHRIHVNAKNSAGEPLLACQDCHGPVETMTTAEQWAPLQMGWCVECHNKEREPATEDKPARRNAPVTCNTCHY